MNDDTLKDVWENQRFTRGDIASVHRTVRLMLVLQIITLIVAWVR